MHATHHRPPAATPPHSRERKFATFALGDTLFGLEIQHIQEINRTLRATPVPQTPAAVRGVINLRGNVVTVLDLRTILRIDSDCPLEKTRTIIVHSAGELIGLLVDRVADVLSLSSSDLQPPPANVRGIDGRFFEAVSRLEHGLLVILNVDEVLNWETAEENGERLVVSG